MSGLHGHHRGGCPLPSPPLFYPRPTHSSSTPSLSSDHRGGFIFLSQVDETDPSKVLKVVNVRFRIKPEGDSPSIVVLRVKNTGVLPLDYLLKYPRDDEDEPENWVDKDLQGIDEQTLNLILENKLFICEPRRGHLEVMMILP